MTEVIEMPEAEKEFREALFEILSSDEPVIEAQLDNLQEKAAELPE